MSGKYGTAAGIASMLAGESLILRARPTRGVETGRRVSGNEARPVKKKRTGHEKGAEMAGRAGPLGARANKYSYASNEVAEQVRFCAEQVRFELSM